MDCNIKNCQGEYEAGTITHTVRKQGQVIVIDHVPAQICSVCGDVLLEPETVQHIESILKKSARPDATVPLYEYKAS